MEKLDFLKKYDEFDKEIEDKSSDNKIEHVLYILNCMKTIKTLHPKLKIHFKEDYSEIKISNIRSDHYFLVKQTNSKEFTLIESSLPDLSTGSGQDDNNCNYFKNNTTLENLLDTFFLVLDNLEEFYKNMDALDQLCYVVEPQIITSKTNWRLIKFSEKVFIKIEVVCPLNISSVRCNFFGKDQEVQRLTKIYEEKSSTWDEDLDIYKNLLRIFDIMFLPMKPDYQSEDSLPHCSICFGYRSDPENQIPIVSCDNSKCDSIFHVQCLDRWFSSHKETREILLNHFGVCPFCKEKLSASFSQLLQKR